MACSKKLVGDCTMLNVNNLSKSFGALQVTQGVSFHLNKGARHALVGPNGAGKTTLFKMIAGEEQPDSGNLKLGSTVQLSYVDQHRHDLDAENNVFEEITGGTEHIEVA